MSLPISVEAGSQEQVENEHYLHYLPYNLYLKSDMQDIS